MNYRHIYHAGNFADVFKHIILVTLINALRRKDSPFCFIDTHAGIGKYDLTSEAAQRSKEFEGGIQKILAEKNPPTGVSDYLQCIHAVNPNASLRFYPGSPSIVHSLLRSNDRMILAELHSEDCAVLKKLFSSHPDVSVHHQDGYQSLKAFLPPKERRGLILIDPPYENKDELTQLPQRIYDALNRFKTGIFAIWYPIKNRLATTRFLTHLKQKIQCPILVAEMSIYPDDSNLHLNGCGVAIINPPWQVEEELQNIVPWLWKTLSIKDQGRYLLNLLS